MEADLTGTAHSTGWVAGRINANQPAPKKLDPDNK